MVGVPPSLLVTSCYMPSPNPSTSREVSRQNPITNAMTAYMVGERGEGALNESNSLDCVGRAAERGRA